MDDAPEVDVTKLMEEIRAKIRTRQQEVPRLDAVALPTTDAVTTDVALLQSDYDIYHVNFTSHRKGLGRLVVLAKKALRQLMTPILERQLAYNAANARVAAHLYQKLEEMGQQHTAALQELSERLHDSRQQHTAALQELSERLNESRQQHTAALRGLRTEMMEQLADMVTGKLSELGEQQAAGFQELQDRLKTELRLQEHRLNILLEEARKRLPEPSAPEQLQILAEEERHALDALYVTFEDRFRVSRDDIKNRLRVYLPALHEAKLDADDMLVIDLGCGRGEWLELMREEGLRVRGVDLNRMLIDDCRQRGLDVITSDALSYLRSLADASVGAVTAFHLIEHLPFEVFVKLLDETVRVLKPGGVAIFETPNPQNVLVGSYTFYLDPTHRNPLPSPLVKFMAEARGLCRVEVMPLHPYPSASHVTEAGSEVAQHFNEFFFGPQDYAVVGWKV